MAQPPPSKSFFLFVFWWGVRARRRGQAGGREQRFGFFSFPDVGGGGCGKIGGDVGVCTNVLFFVDRAGEEVHAADVVFESETRRVRLRRPARTFLSLKVDRGSTRIKKSKAGPKLYRVEGCAYTLHTHTPVAHGTILHNTHSKLRKVTLDSGYIDSQAVSVAKRTVAEPPEHSVVIDGDGDGLLAVVPAATWGTPHTEMAQGALETNIYISYGEELRYGTRPSNRRRLCVREDLVPAAGYGWGRGRQNKIDRSLTRTHDARHACAH